MSVQMNQYFGFGYFLNYKEAIKALESKYSEEDIEEIMDKYHDSAFKREVVSIDGCSMIVDGMSGKYIFFGVIEEKSEVYEPLQSFTVKSPKRKVKLLIQEKIQEIFGTDFNMKPSQVLLTHYR